MAYRQKREVTFPILADGGSKTGLLLEEKADQITESGFGDGVSGRMLYHSHHAYRQGEASLIDITFTAEYDSDSDLQAMVRVVDNAFRTSHSRVLRVT